MAIGIVAFFKISRFRGTGAENAGKGGRVGAEYVMSLLQMTFLFLTLVKVMLKKDWFTVQCCSQRVVGGRMVERRIDDVRLARLSKRELARKLS